MEEDIRKDLYDFIGRELHETAWRANLPINPSIGLNCFLEALRDKEFNLIYNKREKSVKFDVFWKDRDYSTILTYEEILKGWNHAPPSTLKEFYNSIYKIHDNIGDQIRKEGNEKRSYDWNRFRDSYPRIVRERMEEHILPYFMKHHEHMFLPFSYEIPELIEPKIFNQVIIEYPLHVHQKVAEWETLSEDWRCGPCPEYINESEPEEFNFEYFPSGNSMTQYFWGLYLERFAKIKGYQPSDSNYRTVKERLRNFVVRGENGFRESGAFWREMGSPYEKALASLVVK